MMQLNFAILDEQFTIHRFDAAAPIPLEQLDGFFTVSRTADELSIVCDATIPLPSDHSSYQMEDGWSCLQIVGQLDFSLTGILAGVATVLADADVSIFAISTFDTDYILVKTVTLPVAIDTLRAAGHTFREK